MNYQPLPPDEIKDLSTSFSFPFGVTFRLSISSSIKALFRLIKLENVIAKTKMKNIREVLQYPCILQKKLFFYKNHSFFYVIEKKCIQVSTLSLGKKGHVNGSQRGKKRLR